MPPPAEPTTPSRRGPFIITIALGSLVLIGLVALWLHTWALHREAPRVDLAGVDPEVAHAIIAARAAVEKSPHTATTWGALGMTLAAYSFAREAAVCFAEAEQLDHADPRWPYYQGSEFCQAEPTVAIAKLLRAVELGGAGADTARLRLGEVLLRENLLDEAEEQFNHVLQKLPNDARAHLGLARLARERSKLPDALAHLAYCATDGHAQKSSYLLAAEIHQRLGNTTAAEQDRAHAAKLPNDADWPDAFIEAVTRLRTGKQVRLSQASGLIGEGRAAEAILALEQLVKDYPDSDWAWTQLGRAHLALKQWVEAESALRKATALAPTSSQAHFYLGTTMLLQQKHAEAAASFRRTVEVKPDFAEAYHNLAQCLLAQQDEAGALAAFRAAINAKPNFAPAHSELGELLAKKGATAEAIVHLRHAIELNPSDTNAVKLLQQLQSHGAPPSNGR